MTSRKVTRSRRKKRKEHWEADHNQIKPREMEQWMDLHCPTVPQEQAKLVPFIHRFIHNLLWLHISNALPKGCGGWLSFHYAVAIALSPLGCLSVNEERHPLEGGGVRRKHTESGKVANIRAAWGRPQRMQQVRFHSAGQQPDWAGRRERAVWDFEFESLFIRSSCLASLMRFQTKLFGEGGGVLFGVTRDRAGEV